jgi:hypothetical protein
MSEITSKEKIIKNIRKALVVPFKNPLNNMELEESIYNTDTLSRTETIITSFLEQEKKYFQVFNNKYEFLLALKKLMDKKKWRDFVCHTQNISDLLEENGIPFHVNSPESKSPMITTVNKLISKPSTVVFDLRYHLFRKIIVAPVLIIVAFENQIVPFSSDKKTVELTPMDNHSLCMVKTEALKEQEVYLFLINDHF